MAKNADRIRQFFDIPNGLDSVSHNGTESMILHSKHNKKDQDPTHAIIWCHGLASKTKYDQPRAEAIDRLFEDDKYIKRPPSAIVLMSQKGENKEQSAQELLEALQQKGYKSFSVVAFSGGSHMAQKLMEASSDTDHTTQEHSENNIPFKGAVILSPVTQTPKMRYLGRMFQKHVNRKAPSYLVHKQKSDTDYSGKVTVLYDQYDRYIRKSKVAQGKSDEQVQNHYLGDISRAFKGANIQHVPIRFAGDHESPLRYMFDHLPSPHQNRSFPATAQDRHTIQDQLNPIDRGQN